MAAAAVAAVAAAVVRAAVAAATPRSDATPSRPFCAPTPNKLGAGQVFKAQMASTGETLALKTVNVDPNMMDRELEILSQLSLEAHPNIVQVRSRKMIFCGICSRFSGRPVR